MAVIDSAAGLWRLGNYSGAGDILDESGNGYDLGIAGSPTFTPETASTLAFLTFNGSSDALSFFDASDPLSPHAGDFSVVHIARSDGDFPWIGKRNGFGANAGWTIRETGTNGLLADLGDGTSEYTDQAANPIVPGAIQAFGFTLNRTSEELIAYIDGVPSGSPTNTTGMGSVTGASFTIGALSGPVSYKTGDWFAAAVWPGTALSATDMATAGQELQQIIGSYGKSNIIRSPRYGLTRMARR